MTNLHAEDPRRYPVVDLCRLFGKSKQGYYQRDLNRPLAKAVEEDFALSYIKSIRAKDPGIGGKKIWHMYKRQFGEASPIGRERFEGIIDRYGLKVRRRMRKPRTTDSTHGLPTYPNLVKDLIPTRANQIWVSDITYIPIWRSRSEYYFCYLSLIMDAYSEKIVGWSVGHSLETKYPLQALDMALERLKSSALQPGMLIHHSDRGVQYASEQYVSRLKSNRIVISMTQSGDPKDNPQAERINNTMKNELLKDSHFTSIQQVRAAVDAAVLFYNDERPHMSIGMQTPSQAALLTGERQKHWISYRERYIKSSLGLV